MFRLKLRTCAIQKPEQQLIDHEARIWDYTSNNFDEEAVFDFFLI